MARGLRSNRLKKNKTKLRAKVFDPVIDERTKRLSERLAEVVAAPRPDREMTEKDEPAITEDQMDADVQSTEDPSAEAMDVEGTAPTRKASKSKRLSLKERRKLKKEKRRKPQNLIKFKTMARNPNARRRRQPRI